MPEFLMHRTVLILSLFAYPILGAFPSHANEISDDADLAAELREDFCLAPTEKGLGNIGQTTMSARCEPLPVALDLRFIEDDYSGLSYRLPVALDLDWESGEP